jgi:hypothetical protein
MPPPSRAPWTPPDWRPRGSAPAPLDRQADLRPGSSSQAAGQPGVSGVDDEAGLGSDLQRQARFAALLGASADAELDRNAKRPRERYEEHTTTALGRPGSTARAGEERGTAPGQARRAGGR